jgi:hypothetical protein
MIWILHSVTCLRILMREIFRNGIWKFRSSDRRICQ